MKICKDCAYYDKVAHSVNLGMIAICKHPECRDAITGEPVPAVMARQQLVYCTFEARYFHPKEQAPKERLEGKVIQL